MSSPAAPKKVISIDDAVELIGMGKYQARILMACGCCFAADAMEVLLLSFLAIILQLKWGLSEDETSAITASVFAGALLGTLVLGAAADNYGRRKTFFVTSLMISVFGIFTAFSTSYNMLLVLRFFVGFGVGGLVVPFDTMAEFIPTSHRGAQLMMLHFFWAFGTMFVPIFAYITLGQTGTVDPTGTTGFEPWRGLVLLCSIPCLLSFVLCFFFVPESPRWLVTINRTEEALDILREAAANNKKDPLLLFPQGTQLLDDSPEEKRTNMSDLFSRQWIRTTLSLYVVWFCFALLYYGAIIFITMIFASTTNNNRSMSEMNGSISGYTYHFDYIGIFLSAFSEVIGLSIVMFTIDRCGRIPTQAVGYFMAGSMMLTLGFMASSSSSSTRTAPTARGVIILLAFLSRMFASSASCVTWVSTPEILPTEIRATGHSAANAIARIGGAIAPFIASTSTPYPTIGISFFIIGSVATLFSLLLPETKNTALGYMHHTHDAEKTNTNYDGSTQNITTPSGGNPTTETELV